MVCVGRNYAHFEKIKKKPWIISLCRVVAGNFSSQQHRMQYYNIEKGLSH